MWNRLLITGIIVLQGTALVFLSCKNETTGVIVTSGLDTLSSDIEWSGSIPMIPGFDFSQSRIRYIEYNLAESIIDLSIEVQSNGNIPYGAIFTLQGTRPFIQDMGILPLEEISEAPETDYVSLLQNISPGHSYCIVTAEGNYAKIHLEELLWDTRLTGSPYAWIKFEWEYQPDGGRVF